MRTFLSKVLLGSICGFFITGSWLLVITCSWLLVIRYWVPVTRYWLLVTCRWVLAAGHWLVVGTEADPKIFSCTN